jgi:arsenite methyltransferase
MNEYLLNNDFVDIFDETPLWSAPFGLTLLDNIPYKSIQNVLDIGCGTGFPGIEIAQRLGIGSTVYCLDPWKEALNRLEFKLKTAKIKNVMVTCGIAEEMPFQDNFFDLIISNNGLNNVRDITKVASECSRTAKPTADLIFTFNSSGTMIEFYNQFELLLMSHNMTLEIENLKNHIISKRPAISEMIKHFTENGFILVDCIENQFYMSYADGSAFLNHFFIKAVFLNSWEEIVPEDVRKDFFKELEARLNKYSIKNNGLKLSIPYVCVKMKNAHFN